MIPDGYTARFHPTPVDNYQLDLLLAKNTVPDTLN